MKTTQTLALTLSLACAFTLGAAPDDNPKRKRQESQPQQQQQQVVAPQTGKRLKTGPGNKAQWNGPVQNQSNVNGPHGQHFKKKNQDLDQQTNVSGDAANAKLKKSKVGSGNMANANAGGGGNVKKFEKKKFNLQTNNTKVVINKYKTVKFNANYKIAGAHKWKGPKYAVFVNYHPVWQNQWWWSQHYHNIVFIYGGWYYWDANYWYPAWGYDPGSVYYFDGPIYASNPEWDPAQVVANVQSALQQEGYYQGDIDGVLGPQTRAALADYQSAQGLEPTGAVDEPTLETLGMA